MLAGKEVIGAAWAEVTGFTRSIRTDYIVAMVSAATPVSTGWRASCSGSRTVGIDVAVESSPDHGRGAAAAQLARRSGDYVTMSLSDLLTPWERSSGLDLAFEMVPVVLATEITGKAAQP